MNATVTARVQGGAAFLMKRGRKTTRAAFEEMIANATIWGAALGIAPNRVRTVCAHELRGLDQVAS